MKLAVGLLLATLPYAAVASPVHERELAVGTAFVEAVGSQNQLSQLGELPWAERAQISNPITFFRLAKCNAGEPKIIREQVAVDFECSDSDSIRATLYLDTMCEIVHLDLQSFDVIRVSH